MRRIYLGLIVLALILSLSAPAWAAEVNGEILLLTGQDTKADKEFDQAYRGEIGLLQIGPIRALAEAQFLGDANELSHLASLWRQELEAGDIPPESQGAFAAADVAGKIRVDWPLPQGTSLIGSVGYRFNGHLYYPGQANEPEYALYQGLTYGGGLGIELVRGLQAYGIYEMAPSMNSTYPDDTKNATFSAWDVGLEYKIPFLKAKAGMRSQALVPDSEQRQSFTGAYLGVGIHF